MSTQVTTAMVQQYKSGITTLVQQKGSRLRKAVRVEMVDGEFAYFDQIGAGTAVERTSRHQDTPLTETPHARRQVSMRDFEYADLLDKVDQIRLLNDPTNAYSQAAADSLGRQTDDIIIAAATGVAKTGKTGSGTASLGSGNKVAVAATGLTLAKLLSAKEILDAFENDPDEERFIACRAKDISTLLGTQQVTSSDYNTVKALAAGAIDSFLGFKFIRTQRLITSTDGSSIACLAWRRSGLVLGVGSDIKARITERADKSFSTQVFASLSAGASRMEEEAVVEISVQV